MLKKTDTFSGFDRKVYYKLADENSLKYPTYLLQIANSSGKPQQRELFG
jgi:hypothetical protein